ncbi:MAG: hypothetical protein Q9201_007282 [Fulgogasparrea decipioides]
MTGKPAGKPQKILPSLASINGLQREDYAQRQQGGSGANTDRSISNSSWREQLHEDQKDRDTVMARLQDEKTTVDSSIRYLETRVALALDLKQADAMKALASLQEALERDVMALRNELEGYRDIDPQRIKARMDEIVQLKAKAGRWTNNIEILEGWLRRVLGADKERMNCLQKECYGADYVEGDGLREL